jgi:hypothetical protein
LCERQIAVTSRERRERERDRERVELIMGSLESARMEGRAAGNEEARECE